MIFWIIIFAIAVLAAIGLVLIPVEHDDSRLQESETHFWANKCHEAFDNAQAAFEKGDEYSFRKFAEQHALYYRRYRMARDGHFERKTE